MQRTITITGKFTGTLTQQRTFITAIDTIAAGSQTGVAYISGLVTSPANRTVFVQSWDWTTNLGDLSKIDYTMILVEGAAVA